jgi:predicted ester cyclase
MNGTAGGRIGDEGARSVKAIAGHHYLHPHTTEGSMRFVSPDVIYQSGPEGQRTYLHWEENHHRLLGAFEITGAEILHQVAEDDLVITHWRGEARHIGKFQDLEATGKTVVMRGYGMDRVSGGLVVEHWGLQDAWGLMRQLGFAASAAAPAKT